MADQIIQFSRVSPDVQPPKRMSDSAAGYDVSAFLNEAVEIEPGEIAVIPTGLKAQLPEGFMLSVRPRSGLAFKFGISVINSPGTIDADFRGEIKIALINHSNHSFTVSPGDRIAQFILERFYTASWQEGNIENSNRGEQGFGSTGLS